MPGFKNRALRLEKYMLPNNDQYAAAPAYTYAAGALLILSCSPLTDYYYSAGKSLYTLRI